MKTNLLKIEGVQVLKKNMQKSIIGGLQADTAMESFDCHCKSEEDHARVFKAKSIKDALARLEGICGDLGGECTGTGIQSL